MARTRFPLTACDVLFITLRRVLASRGQQDGFGSLTLHTEGEIHAGDLTRSFARTLSVHPATASDVRYSRLRDRPFRELRCDPETMAIERFTYEDLRDRPDWLQHWAKLAEERLSIRGSPEAGPQVHLDYYAGPRGEGRVCMRAAHDLFDLEGGQCFVSEIARLGKGGAADVTSRLKPDRETADPLRGISLLERLRLSWRGLRALRRDHPARMAGLDLGSPSGGTGYRIRHRVFQPDEFRRIKENARRLCPFGPGLFARYLAGCVIRSLHRLYRARGVEIDAYLLSVPMPFRVAGSRPMHGNYLTGLVLAGRADLVGDARALARDLHAQWSRFLDRGRERTWAVLWLAAKASGWTYRSALRRTVARLPVASGFSYAHEGFPPLREFLGATVTNMWGTGPMVAPPGWNPVFMTFGNRLNFSLNWVKDYVPDALAEEFAEGIEQEAVQGPGHGASRFG